MSQYIHDSVDSILTAMKKISFCILTFHRPHLLEILVQSLTDLTYSNKEIIVVDNSVRGPLLSELPDSHAELKYIRNGMNLGIAGRNIGLRNAKGEYIITLDDDIYGITDESLRRIVNIFSDNPNIGAICFKIIDEKHGRCSNWCHHYKLEEFENRYFDTNEISEGAVAFRRDALVRSGLYPSDFFISHEGADLACRLINNGYRIIYCPDVVVKHNHAFGGREDWRRYYFDTRNQVWFVARNYPIWMGLKYLSRGLVSMFIYCLRDGYVKWYVSAIFDALKKLPEVLKERNVIGADARYIIRKIEQNRPGLGYMLKRRMFTRGVRI